MRIKDMITQDKSAGGAGGLDVKFNTYRRALLFHSFLQTGKVVEELLKFKYKYSHWNKTDKFINSKVF